MGDMPGQRPLPRRDAVARLLRLILMLNLGVAVTKLVLGRVAGSLALTADGFHALLDSASNVVGLIGVGVARRPPDADHPYGHRKFETFAAAGIAGLLFLGCREIAAGALSRFNHPVAPHDTPLVWAVLAATIVVNVLVVVIERRAGRRLGSELLISDAAHTQSDVLASLLVVGGFGLQRLGLPWADLAATVAIVVLILRAGVEILRGTLSTLADQRRIAPAEVERAVLDEPGVLEAHNVRSRGPLDDIHVDLHILVDPVTPLAEAHRIAHRVERLLLARFAGVTDVVVHVEPGLEVERATHREGGGLRAEG